MADWARKGWKSTGSRFPRRIPTLASFCSIGWRRESDSLSLSSRVHEGRTFMTFPIRSRNFAMSSFIVIMCCSTFYVHEKSRMSATCKTKRRYSQEMKGKWPYLLVDISANVPTLLVSNLDPADVKRIYNPLNCLWVRTGSGCQREDSEMWVLGHEITDTGGVCIVTRSFMGLICIRAE